MATQGHALKLEKLCRVCGTSDHTQLFNIRSNCTGAKKKIKFGFRDALFKDDQSHIHPSKVCKTDSRKLLSIEAKWESWKINKWKEVEKPSLEDFYQANPEERLELAVFHAHLEFGACTVCGTQVGLFTSNCLFNTCLNRQTTSEPIKAHPQNEVTRIRARLQGRHRPTAKKSSVA